jgi:hypothetical protein
MVARPSVDLVAHLEAPDAWSNFHNRSGNVVPQDKGWTIGKNKLELSIPDLGVQEVYGRGLDPDQEIIVLQFRFRQVGQTQSALLLVLINDE